MLSSMGMSEEELEEANDKGEQEEGGGAAGGQDNAESGPTSEDRKN